MAEEKNDFTEIIGKLKEKIKTLPVPARKHAARIFRIFKDIVEVEVRNSKEIDRIYDEYEKQIFAITSRQDDLIEGKTATTAEEFEFWKTNMDPQFVQATAADKPEPIKDFWKRFMMNSGVDIGEHDDRLFSTLTHVSFFRETAKEGDKQLVVRKLLFKFQPNEFFSNTELTVSAFEEEESGKLLRTEGTKIQWTNNPTVTKKETKKKNKKTNEVKVFVKEV